MSFYSNKLLRLACTCAVFLFVGQISLGSDIRLSATSELESLGFDTNLQTLVQLAYDASAESHIRQVAAIAISESADHSSFDILLPLLNVSDSGTRIAAVAALANLTDPRSIPHFAEILSGNEQWSTVAKHYALNGLAKIDNDDARNAILHVTSLPNLDGEIRISLVEMLGRWTGLESDLPLQQFVNDPDREIRARAAIHLSNRYPSSYDRQLIEAATDRELPHYIWVKVVHQLEDNSGQTFFDVNNRDRRREHSAASEEINTLKMTAFEKDKVLTRIESWLERSQLEKRN